SRTSWTVLLYTLTFWNHSMIVLSETFEASLSSTVKHSFGCGTTTIVFYLTARYVRRCSSLIVGRHSWRWCATSMLDPTRDPTSWSTRSTVTLEDVTPVS
ncbi:unnamed protein product, partial [Nesidiocoris tenuis]